MSESVAARLPRLSLHEVALLHPGNRDYLLGNRSVVQAKMPSAIFFFVMFFFVTGLLLMAVTAREWYRFALLNFDSAHTSAQFVSKTIESDEDLTYYVTSAYTVDGQVYTSRSVVSSNFYATADNRSYLITYAQADPQVAVIGDPSAGIVIWLSMLSLVWGAITWGLLFRMVQKWLRARHLAQHGQIILGEITGSSRKLDSDGSYLLEISFGFASPQTGAALTGRDSAIRNDLKMSKSAAETGTAPIRMNTPVVILYGSDRNFLLL